MAALPIPLMTCSWGPYIVCALVPPRRSALALAALLLATACGSEALSLRPGFLAASTETLDFGDVELGNDGTLSLYLINKGDKEIRLLSSSDTGAGGVFAVLARESVIPPNSDLVIEVVFTPADVTSYEARIPFDNDSHNAPDIEVLLLGRGTEGVPTNPCDGVTCATPWPPVCVGMNTSRIYQPPGTCTNGTCDFPSFNDEDCGGFDCDFATGLCKSDPCFGIVCQTPPNDCFSAVGACIDGACQYNAEDTIPCTDGDPCTQGDSCSQGTCRGTPRACNQASSPMCIDLSTLRQWDPLGTCDALGSCHYDVVDITCGFGCNVTLGQCEGDPCVGGCDDANPCTLDECVLPQGCVHSPQAGSCVAADNDCPNGECVGGNCLPKAGEICEASYDVDLCQSTTVAGICTGAGECVVDSVPPDYQCPNCNGICLECYIIQVCIPLF